MRLCDTEPEKWMRNNKVEHMVWLMHRKFNEDDEKNMISKMKRILQQLWVNKVRKNDNGIKWLITSSLISVFMTWGCEGEGNRGILHSSPAALWSNEEENEELKNVFGYKKTNDELNIGGRIWTYDKEITEQEIIHKANQIKEANRNNVRLRHVVITELTDINKCEILKLIEAHNGKPIVIYKEDKFPILTADYYYNRRIRNIMKCSNKVGIFI